MPNNSDYEPFPSSINLNENGLNNDPALTSPEAQAEAAAHEQGQSVSYDELEQKSQREQNQLQQASARAADRLNRNKKSLVGRAGLDHLSATGEAINAGANITSGASRVVGHMLSTTPTAIAGLIQHGFTEEQIAAYNRLAQGNATEQDKAILDDRTPNRPNNKKRFPKLTDSLYKGDKYQTAIQNLRKQEPSVLDRFKKMRQFRVAADAINETADISSIIHTADRDKLVDELSVVFKEDWRNAGKNYKNGNTKEAATNIGDIIAGTFEAAGGNVGAVLGLMAENLPQVGVGAFGKTGQALLSLSNAGYAGDAFNDGINDFKEKNNGAIPTGQDLLEIAAWAGSIFLAETIGDKAVLSAAGVGGKISKTVSKTAAGKAGAKALKAAKVNKVTNLGIVKGPVNVTKAAVTGGAGETLTEGYQTYAEKAILNESASAEEIFTGAALGGLAGGGLSTAGRVASGTAKALSKPTKKKAKPTSNVDIKTAITDGDVAPLLDKKSASYAPDKAINALMGHSKQETTTPEQKKADLEQAANIVSDLKQELATKEKSLEQTSAEAIATKTTELEGYKADLVEAKKTDDNQELVANLTKLIETEEASIEQAADIHEASLKGKTKLEALISSSEKALSVFNQEIQAVDKQVDVAEQIAIIKETKEDSDRDVASDSIINLSMAAPERISDEQATDLANDQSNGLTGPVRAYWRSFSAARAARNELATMNQVSQEVLRGGGIRNDGTDRPNLGIQQYRENVAAALLAGNEDLAKQHLTDLRAFNRSHQNKSKAVNAAYESYQETGNTSLVRPDNNQGWTTELVTENKVTPKQLKKEGALEISPASAKLAREIGVESEAISLALKELQASYDLKYPRARVNKNTSIPQPPSPEPTTTKPTTTSSQPTTNVSSVAPANELTEEVGVDEVVIDNKEDINTPSKSVTSTDPASAVATAESSEVTPEKKKKNRRGLAVLRDVKEQIGKAYRDANFNKVIAYLKQSKDNNQDDPNINEALPLVEIENFYTQWTNGDITPADFYAKEMTDEEVSALVSFKKFADEWIPLIKKNLIKGSLPNARTKKKTREDYLYRDPIQDFFNEDGTIDENVVTAIAYGAWAWMADNVNGPGLREADAILAMHGITKTDENSNDLVTVEGLQVLGKMTGLKHSALNNMGKHVVSVLGLKLKKEGPEPTDYINKLNTAFGIHVMELLNDNGVGLISNEQVSGEALATYLPSFTTVNTGEYVNYSYISINRNVDKNTKRHELTIDAKTIKDATRESRGITEKIFGSEPSRVFASWEPIKFAQTLAKRTGQRVSDKQKEILKKSQQVPNLILPDMWTTLDILGDEAILQIAGWLEFQEEKVQAENRDALEARNLGLEDELDSMKVLVQSAINTSDKGINQPFYAAMEVWRNFRVGVATRDMNLQSSKIHRAMFSRPDWSSTIPLDGGELEIQFLISLAQAMGIKVDAQPNQETLNIWAQNNFSELALKLNNAIKTNDKNQLTTGDIAAIVDVVKNAEGMQSLQGLVQYGNYLAAKRDGNSEFVSQLLVGVDGKTNGPIFTHLALGAASTSAKLLETLARGGMYTAASGVKNYNHWIKGTSAQDLYQDLSGHILKAIPQTPMLAAVHTFTQALINEDGKVTSSGRNLSKTPLTSFIFGASVKSSVTAMENAFVQSVFDRIEKVANGVDTSTTLDELISSLNTLMNLQGKKAINKNTTIDSLMNRKFSASEKESIASAFYDAIGSSAEHTMKIYFGKYLERRNAVTSSIQSSYGIYSVIHDELLQKELDTLMDEGKIDFNLREGKRVPIHGMTSEQEAAFNEKIKGIIPLTNTAFTQEDNDLGAGILMSKTKLQRKGDTENDIKVEFGRPIYNQNGKQVSHSLGQPMERVNTAPGVGGLSYFIHSLDSYVMHSSLEDTHTLNVHDEAANGVGNIVETAKAINESTWNGLLNFSPAVEVHSLLSKTLIETSNYIKSGQLSDAAIKKLAETLLNNLPFEERSLTKLEDLADSVINASVANLLEMDKVRLEALSQLTSIDQYTWEGGEYEVTAKDRQKAKDMLAKHLADNTTASAELLAAGQILTEAFSKIDKTVKPTIEDASEQPIAEDSVFGAIGNPSINSDSDIVDLFNDTGSVSGTDVIKFLSQPGRMNKINHKILLLVYKVMKGQNQNVEITMVTPQTKESDVIELPKVRSRAWTVIKGDIKQVYVLSPEFTDSGLTSETLLHELIHTILAQKIQNPIGPIKGLVAELELLREAAIDFVEKNGIDKFSPALTNVHEFVSWGMTNFEFQQEVLSKIQFKSKTKKNKFVQAMQQFVETLSALLFNEPSKKTDTGLAVLISNVSGLAYASAAATASPTRNTINLSQAVGNIVIDRFTTQEIFQALGNGSISSNFSNHLQGILKGIVLKLHGPFGTFSRNMRKTEAGNPYAIWLKAVESGKAPFASELIASGFSSSAQEDFVMEQVEATVRAAIDSKEGTTKVVYRQLVKLYAEMKNKLKPSDFASRADYDLIFDVKINDDGFSDYLSRFAAIGLSNEKFNNILKEVSTDDYFNPSTDSSNSLASRIKHLFELILEFFNQKLTHTHKGQTADSILETLVDRLVDIEAKKRHSLTMRNADGDSLRNVLTKTSEAITDVAEGAKKVVHKVASNPSLKNSSNIAVETGARLVRLAASDQVLAAIQEMKGYRDRHFEGKLGLIAGIVNDAVGYQDQFMRMFRATKIREADRQKLMDQTRVQTQSVFRMAGKFLTEAQNTSIAKVIMGTGAHTLIDDYSLSEVEQLISNADTRSDEINILETELGSLPGVSSGLVSSFIEQVNALGYFNVTGRVRTEVLMLNGYLISTMNNQMAGLTDTQQKPLTTTQARAAQDILTKLITLYGFNYVTQIDRDNATDVFRQELNRSTVDPTDRGNGIEFVLKMQKTLEQESLETLFSNNPALMQHGYMPEIVNPHTKLVIASPEQAEAQNLINRGFSKGADVTKDSADPDKVIRTIYVQKDGGLAPWLSGVFSFTDLHAKGAKLDSTTEPSLINTTKGVADRNASFISAKQSSVMARNKNPKRDMTTDRQNHTVPIFNDAGNISDWRYMMEASTKDGLLERNNDFSTIMGALTGSVFDKESTDVHNEKAVEALRQQFNEDYALNADAYLDIGPNSPDKEMRDIWQLLPESTKRAVKKVWGRDGMKVRNDIADLMFGYRKLSLSSMFEKEQNGETLKLLEKVIIAVVEASVELWGRGRHQLSGKDAENYAKRAAIAITRGERAWQETISATKDIIVNKTGVVMIGNIVSNFSFLSMSGVPIKDMLEHHLVAIKGANSYIQDNRQLAELERKLNINYSDKAHNELVREIAILKDSIARNPVKELIDAGLMPTIVEDVQLESDPYSYKTALASKIEGVVNKIPSGIREVGKQLYMTHDTAIYKALSHTTQLSDFVARYTLYQHTISRKKNPLSKQDAVEHAYDTFVAYDIPMHRTLQYSDDMGFTMFTKYFLRIQRVLIKLMREHPADVLKVLLLHNYFDWGSIVTDGSFLAHVGNNPLTTGAFQYPEALTELGTIESLDSALGVFR